MFTLTALRPAFAAAFSASLLAVFSGIFTVPGAFVCGAPREPNFSYARRWVQSQTDVVVTITPEGQFRVGDIFVPPRQLGRVLTEAYVLDPRRRLVVRPDVRTPFGAVRSVLRQAQSLGIRRIIIPSGVRSVG
jgi:hypothetical protein